MKNITDIRADFPILGRKVYGKPLVYFDNGATTQKPQCVLDAVDKVYKEYNGNIHRGVHFLSDMSSEAYESARENVRSFINAEKREEVIFTSGTTGSINVPVLIDGAQGIQHGIVDLKEMDCDFYVFSGHKIYGPNGIGVLYGKEKWLAEMPPFQGGGDMVDKVTFEKTTYNELPFKFEAGTMNYPAAIGLASALDYVTGIGRDYIASLEKELLSYANKRLSAIKDLTIYGQSEHKISTISFHIRNIHQYDTGMILDKMGIAVRTGTHCAQPVMDHYGIDGTVRASLCFYNTKEEIDALADGIEKVKTMLA